MDYVASGSEDGAVYVYGWGIRLLWTLNHPIRFRVLDGSIAAKLDHIGDRKIVHSLACHPKKNHLLSTDGVSLFLWTPRGTVDNEWEYTIHTPFTSMYLLWYLSSLTHWTRTINDLISSRIFLHIRPCEEHLACKVQWEVWEIIINKYLSW